ncbi:calcium-binding protein [Nocardioides speluncae]|uniref:calcium-binding protein n=1 Tax=Nocardioides speluncae TaxID=2670337 RepID=UPI000D68A447|nr:calcium-binding protein [Nocardioides speluncae]
MRDFKRCTGWTGAALLLAMLTAPAAGGAAAAVPTCFGKKATIVGTEKTDRLFGTDGPDVIVGRGGDDVIKGRGGDDLICGNYGADRLSGGPGRDSLNGGKGKLVDISPGDGEEAWGVEHDVFLPGPGNDYLVLGVDRRATTLDLPDHVSYANSLKSVRVDIPNRRITGEGIDLLAGARVAVTGSSQGDVMLGGPGADHFRGHGGPDILLGRGGNDSLFDHTSPDAVANGDRRERDRLEGGDGDRIESRGGIDVLIGGPGRDELRSFGDSPDIVLGGPGGDFIQDNWVRGRGATVDGGSGHDTLWPDLRFWQDGKRVYPPTTIDLRSGVTTIDGAATTTMQVVGVESLEWWDGGALTFHGTDADEFIGPTDIELRGRLRAYGYGGDDEFGGSARDDFIDGGAGTDSAHTHGGVDRCISVEQTFDRDSCEVNG